MSLIFQVLDSFVFWFFFQKLFLISRFQATAIQHQSQRNTKVGRLDLSWTGWWTVERHSWGMKIPEIWNGKGHSTFVLTVVIILIQSELLNVWKPFQSHAFSDIIYIIQNTVSRYMKNVHRNKRSTVHIGFFEKFANVFLYKLDTSNIYKKSKSESTSRL